jgi:two-component sensor histidine kinase
VVPQLSTPLSPEMKEDPRTEAIINAIMALARLDFSYKLPLDDKGDTLTAISSGVNMLGEELQDNVISLKEKEQLLKELHHRVKNNMQIIVSMLRLQTAHEENPRLLAIVRDSQNRINAMALVHEMLYNTNDFVFTRLREYVDFLSTSLFMSYAPPQHEIELDLLIDENIFFEIDQMIPLGLILNEMMSNSLKHAFKDGKGRIRVEASLDEEGWCTISYEDNGSGLPKNFNLEKAESFGMQLIMMLADQMDGDIRFQSNSNSRQKGLKYELRFI